jgi:hypothetical protein
MRGSRPVVWASVLGCIGNTEVDILYMHDFDTFVLLLLFVLRQTSIHDPHQATTRATHSRPPSVTWIARHVRHVRHGRSSP